MSYTQDILDKWGKGLCGVRWPALWWQLNDELLWRR